MLAIVFGFSLEAIAVPPNKDNARTKFYNFDDMLIDGEIKKPTGLFINIRERARFKRLLKLKKTFIPNLMSTAREKLFK